MRCLGHARRLVKIVVISIIVFHTPTLTANASVITDPNQLSPGYTLIDFEGFTSPPPNPLTIGNATFTSLTGNLSFFNVSGWPTNGTEIASLTLFPGGEPDSAISIQFAVPVSQFLLGWGDPNFSGNVLRAYDAAGNLLEEGAVALGPIGGVHAAWIGFKRSTADIAKIIVQPDQSLPSGDDYVIDNIFFNPARPFARFSARLEAQLDPDSADDSFQLNATFTLGTGSNGINP